MKMLMLIMAIIAYVHTLLAISFEDWDFDDLVAFDRYIDSKERIAALQPLADAGIGEAQFEIATLYVECGEPEQAAKWYQKVVDQHDLDAQICSVHYTLRALCELGVLYCKGEGVKKNTAKGLEYLAQAAKGGDKDAQKYLDSIERKKRGKLSIKEEIDALKPLAEAGISEAQVDIALKYMAEKEPARAVEWFRKAVDQHDLNALFHLGAMYCAGTGVEKDLTKGIRYLTEAVNGGHRHAQKLMEKIWTSVFQTMLSEHRPAKERVAFLKTMADRGCTVAEFLLSPYYFEGNGVEKNVTEAKRLLKSAAAGGVEDAKKALALLEKYEDAQRILEQCGPNESSWWNSMMDTEEAIGILGKIR